MTQTNSPELDPIKTDSNKIAPKQSSRQTSAPTPDQPESSTLSQTTPNYDHNELSQLIQDTEKGNAQAQYLLAQAYYYGDVGLKEDESLALQWFKAAAENGHPKAQMLMGNLYYYGALVKQDYPTALHWYEKAANAQDLPQISSSALNLVAHMYAQGQGCQPNQEKSAQSYLKSAEQGNAYGQYQIGMRYLYGIGVAQDLSLARQFLSQAAEQGLLEAQRQLQAPELEDKP